MYTFIYFPIQHLLVIFSLENCFLTCVLRGHKPPFSNELEGVILQESLRGKHNQYFVFWTLPEILLKMENLCQDPPKSSV